MERPTVVTPIIHLNGNRLDTLIEPLEQAYRAVHAAIEALQQTAPNGRNYYPEPGRLARATTQHAERLQHLSSVYRSIEAEIIQLDEENPRASGDA